MLVLLLLLVLVAMSAAMQTCGICSFDLEAHDLVQALLCGHVLHEACIVSYCLAAGGGLTVATMRCPICRTTSSDPAFRTNSSDAAFAPRHFDMSIPNGQPEPLTPVAELFGTEPSIVILRVWHSAQ